MATVGEAALRSGSWAQRGRAATAGVMLPAMPDVQVLRVGPTTRRRARSASPYEEAFGFSRAVRVGKRVLVSGTAPIWPDGSCPPEASIQAERCFEIILTAMAELGARPEDVVRTRMYIVDPADAEAVGRAHRAAMGVARPAATMIVVARLLDPRWRIEVEAEAVTR